VNPGDKKAEEKFKEISEANDILSDEKKRKIYDQFGFYSDQIDPAAAEAAARAGASQGGFGAAGQGQGVPFDFSGFDFSEEAHPGASSSGWGSFRDIFSGMFSRERQPHGPQAGTDLEYQANVDFWTAIRGGTARLEIQRQEVCPTCHGKASTGGSLTCPECHGTGQVTQMGGRMKFNIQCPRCGGSGKVTHACPTCHGEGTVYRTEPLEFRIKPGTRDGQRIRLAGKGNAGVDGGAAGDLYLVIRAGPHPVFTRSGDDILITLPVTVSEAALGSRIEVPTIDGRAQLRIPPGTQNGQKLRMRERGVPSATRENMRGDQIVTVEVAVPHVRDERSREILREFAKLNPDDPREAIWAKV
jgi:molecular chaperone DnaJ